MEKMHIAFGVAPTYIRPPYGEHVQLAFLEAIRTAKIPQRSRRASTYPETVVYNGYLSHRCTKYSAGPVHYG